MVWPTTPVSTANMDESTDSPAAMRADLLQLAQQVNQLQAHVSAFAATLLDDASAAAARTTLGATTVGSQLFQAISQADARSTLQIEVPLGTFQTFTNVTASRALGTNYTSPAARTISVMVTVLGGASDQRFYLSIGGAGENFSTVPAGKYATLTFVVPSDTTYRVEATGCTLVNWFQLGG